MHRCLLEILGYDGSVGDRRLRHLVSLVGLQLEHTANQSLLPTRGARASLGEQDSLVLRWGARRLCLSCMEYRP